MSWRGLSFREWFWVAGPWVLGLAVVIVVIGYFWQPAPPRSIVMATGPEGGAAQRYGERYRTVLAKHGIRVELKTTTGALENRAKLLDDDAKVVAAFVQTGSASAADADWLSAIAGVYPEPLWVFYRLPKPVTQASDLAGRRMAIGARGSGTRRVAVDLFAAYGVDLEAQPHLDITGRAGVEALMAGKVDGMILVSGEDSTVVQEMLRVPGVRLLAFPQSAALSRRFPDLNTVTLSPGVIDLARNLPPQEVPLIAATSQLMVRADLHPALVQLFAEAAKEIHGGSGWFHKAGDFPTLKGTDVPVNADAERYFTSGASFLHSHLPFWFAVWVERAVIILVPLLAIGIPAARVLPVVYSWRMRSRVYRWYAEVRQIENEMSHAPPSAEAVPPIIVRLDQIEQRVDNVRVPLSFARELYDLKEHIDFVRHKLAGIDARAKP
ncbi:MAG TPA: TAXI family TRAP transporter solute-binding subunit [Usitatibacteraceae bacterium]